MNHTGVWRSMVPRWSRNDMIRRFPAIMFLFSPLFPFLRDSPPDHEPDPREEVLEMWGNNDVFSCNVSGLLRKFGSLLGSTFRYKAVMSYITYTLRTVRAPLWHGSGDRIIWTHVNLLWWTAKWSHHSWQHSLLHELSPVRSSSFTIGHST